MIVRLKGAKHIMEDSYGTGFNSMIVRLKALNLQVRKSHELKFQFYDSPIKSPLVVSQICCEISFNSMIVRLKGMPRGIVVRGMAVSIL